VVLRTDHPQSILALIVPRPDRCSGGPLNYHRSYTEGMKSRKWLWGTVAGFCLLALCVGYLARPEDELASLRELRHTEEFVVPVKPFPPRTDFDFMVDPSVVMANLPLPPNSTPDQFLASRRKGHAFTFRSGTRFMFFVDTPDFPGGGVTCGLAVYADSRPWYQRAWSMIKYRLGF